MKAFLSQPHAYSEFGSGFRSIRAEHEARAILAATEPTQYAESHVGVDMLRVFAVISNDQAGPALAVSLAAVLPVLDALEAQAGR